MLTSPRIGKLSGSVYWPDGTTPFQGWAEVVLVLPGKNGGQDLWPRLSVFAGYPTIRLPLWTRVPIVDGAFDQGIGLWYNSDILPQGSQYAAYYYDATGTAVGSATSLFTIAAAATAAPQSITVSPTAGSTIPTPREVV